MNTPSELCLSTYEKFVKEYSRNSFYYTKKAFKRFFFSEFENEFKNAMVDKKYITKLLAAEMGVIDKNIIMLKSIYGEDINYDIMSNNYKILSLLIIFDNNVTNKTKKWIKENISLNSFFNMLGTYHSKINNFVEMRQFNTEINDVFRMIGKIMDSDNPEKLKTICPLRFMEFHNHVVRIHLEATIQNKEYPQEIIKTPIVAKDFIIQQPKNSLDLAQWATAVKNCVFSYEDKVIRKESAILLVSKGGIPQYTIEVHPKFKKNKQIIQLEKIYRGSMDSAERSNITKLVEEYVK